MSALSLLLFDDRTARGWEPFALTRPVGELLLGCLLQRERAERFWKTQASGHLAGSAMRGFREVGAPPAVEPADVSAESLRIVLSSRVVLPFAPSPFDEEPPPVEPASLTVRGEVVGWLLPPGTPTPEESALLDPAGEPRFASEIELGGRVLANVWNLVADNADQLRVDIETLFPRTDAFLPPGVNHIGRGLISIATGVELEPGITIDTRGGPVRVEEGVAIRSMTRLEGPLYLARDSQIFGGSISRASIGPRCKVRGEVEEAVILGFSNKAHDGYLGHAYLGRWVNLGALTTNSDLKNNYGPVRVRTASGDVDTGLTKVGCFLGDHVKTGIGTLLNTGTVVGAGSNLFGGAMPPVYVPPFSWGAGGDLSEYRLDRFLDVAEVVMRRREVALTAEDRAFLETAWRRGRHDAP
ncbi:MAG: putative sugar nucleotidyl transferase [Gemmatimonadota bacterium]